MKILILGKSGTGKSNLSDILRNMIFKMDKDSEIFIDDPDRQNKQFGAGSSIHTIKVIRTEEHHENYNDHDIIITINNNNFISWFNNI